jgi:hypothetical protein
MHRSGTSPITRILNLLGMALGAEERLMPALEGNNPTGFWEHLYIVQINDELLSRLGGSWDVPPELPNGWEQSADLKEVRQRARELLHKDFGEDTFWGWKDPRTCLTLPFWKSMIPHLKYVICIRNPLDVAKSLKVRDDIPWNRALELWAKYNIAALKNTDGEPRLFALYDNLFTDLERELARLASFSNVETPDSDSELHRSIATFLDDGLRHHGTLDSELLDQNSLDFFSTGLYLMLRLPLTSDSGDWDQDKCNKVLDRIAASYVQSDGVLSSLRSVIAELEEDRSQLKRQLADASESRSILERQLSEASESRKTLEQQLVEASESRSTLEGQLVEISKSRSTLEKQLVDISESRKTLENQLVDTLESKSKLHQQLSEVSDSRATLEKELGTILDSKSRLETELAAVTESKSVLKRQLDGVLASRSWTLTAPLRALMQYFKIRKKS